MRPVRPADKPSQRLPQGLMGKITAGPVRGRLDPRSAEKFIWGRKKGLSSAAELLSAPLIYALKSELLPDDV